MGFQSERKAFSQGEKKKSGLVNLLLETGRDSRTGESTGESMTSEYLRIGESKTV